VKVAVHVCHIYDTGRRLTAVGGVALKYHLSTMEVLARE